MKTVSLFFLLLIAACTSKPQNGERQDIKPEILESWQSFISAWENEDARGCAEHYLPDGKNIAPESPVRGSRDEIAKFYDFLFSNHLESDYQHEILELTHADGQAFEIGAFQVDWTRNDSTQWTFNARSSTHWIKDVEGNWKIKSFMFNLPPEE